MRILSSRSYTHAHAFSLSLFPLLRMRSALSPSLYSFKSFPLKDKHRAESGCLLLLKSHSLLSKRKSISVLSSPEIAFWKLSIYSQIHPQPTRPVSRASCPAGALAHLVPMMLFSGSSPSLAALVKDKETGMLISLSWSRREGFRVSCFL